ncbi:hypothetical protein LZL18_22515 [Pseudomonas aeruginosa]|nr:hypothetical protein [Pseudomonas aeruginosa]
MSKQSTSFEIGFALGSVVREFRRALRRPPVVVQAQAPVASSVQRIEPAMLAGPTAKELEHISDVPAIVRLKKVNLNDWYLANTREVQKPKRAQIQTGQGDTQGQNTGQGGAQAGLPRSTDRTG